MCWEHEDKYGTCFDLGWWRNNFSDYSFEEFLTGEMCAFITDFNKVKSDMFVVFSKWHKEGIIRPATDKEISEIRQSDIENLKKDIGESDGKDSNSS